MTPPHDQMVTHTNVPLGPGHWNQHHRSSVFSFFPLACFLLLLHVGLGEEEEMGEGGRRTSRPRRRNRWGRTESGCSDVSGRPLASDCPTDSKKFRLGYKRRWRTGQMQGSGCFWKEKEKINEIAYYDDLRLIVLTNTFII